MTRKPLPGSLEGDFSSFRSDPTHRDSSVRLLQGRMILDSDWNEQTEILTYRRRRGFADLIGPAGAPKEDAGFGVRAEPLLDFDGENHYVVIGGDGVEVWSGGQGFTIEIFFEPTAGAGVLLGRFSRDDGGTFQHDFTLALEADGTVLLHRGGAAIEAPSKVKFGRLNHLALAWSQGTARWWVNGYSAFFEVQMPLRRAPSVAVLGATLRGGQPTQAYRGYLHELRFWGAERGTADLGKGAQLGAFSGGEAKSGAEALVGLWCFNQPPTDLEIPDGGPHGVPARLGGGHARNAPSSRLARLLVEPGRFWLEGMLCHQEVAEEILEPSIEELGGDLWLFYLEAHETLISAARDPHLLEPALGGADTSARSRVVSQVRALRLPEAPAENGAEDLDPGVDGDEILHLWRGFQTKVAKKGRVRARRQDNMIGAEIGNLLYRVEVRSGGVTRGAKWGGAGESDAKWIELSRPCAECTPAEGCIELTVWPDPYRLDVDLPGATEPWRPGDAIELQGETGGPDDKAEDGGTSICAQVISVDAEKRQLVIEAQDLESVMSARNLKARRLATFLWSRDNASVLFPVESVDGDGVNVQLQTTVRQIELEVDQWVEFVASDSNGSQGSLHRVASVNTILGTVALEPSLASDQGAGDASAHAVLRRWDQQPLESAPMVGGAVIVEAGKWQDLGSGVEVCFEPGDHYQAGDYWWMPSRTALSDIEWPREYGKPVAREPDGVGKYRALLATVQAVEDGLEVVDYRRTFQPVIDGAVSKAGDTMYGPLIIESDLRVAGDIEGRRLFGELASPGSVSDFNLQDDSVSARTLAPDVGVVPPQSSILGDTAAAPAGYRFTGASHLFYHQELAWRRLDPMPRTDSRVHAAAGGGLVWLIYESGEVWAYDPAACCWQTGPPLPSSQRDFAVATLDGVIYVVGGEARGRVGSWRLDSQVGSWQECAPLRHGRSKLAAAGLEGHLYAVGGVEGQKASRRLEAYDPVLDSWREHRPLPRGRFDLAAAAVCGRVYALGGAVKPTLDRFGCRVVSRMEGYHPASDRWLDHLAHLPSPRSDLAAATVGDRLFAAGGVSTAGPLAMVDVYDPSPDFWRHSHDFSGAMPSPAAAASSGELYIFGVEEEGQAKGVYAAKVATELFVHRRL